MHGAYHEIIPDRIEAGTFLIIAAAIGEKMVIQNIIPQHLDALISKLKEMGIKMEKIGNINDFWFLSCIFNNSTTFSLNCS